MGMIADLFVKLSLNKGSFDKGLDDAKTKSSAFGNGMKKLGGMIAGVFAVSSIVSFGKELLDIAGKAEGVMTAFNKIATQNDLQVLRNATKGTVSDLELMKRSVSANNFGIPVQQLGKLFEFASKRAQDTGQSVDYLVDSIVTGIGRKSPLILDNLGISAIQLKAKLGSVGMETATVAQLTEAVGKIAEESFTKSGRFADTLGTKIVSLSVKWENFKLSLATNEGFQDFMKAELDDLDKNFTIFFSKNLSKWEKFRNAIDVFGFETDYLYNKSQNADYVAKFLKQPEMESSGGPLEKSGGASKKKIKDIEEENKSLEEQLKLTEVTDKASIIAIGNKIRANNELIKQIDELLKGETAYSKLQEEIKIKAKDLSKLPKGSLVYYEAEIALLEMKQKLITDPHLLAQSKSEIDVKKDMLSQLTGELKLLERKKAEIKDIRDLVYIPEKDSDRKGADKLNMDPSMVARVTASEEGSDVYQSKIDAAKQFTDDLNETLRTGLADAVTTMAVGFGEIMAGGDWSDFGSELLNMVGKFMQTLGGLFITMGISLLKFNLGLSTMNPFVMIGAGALMVAAGAAISSMASNGMKSSATSVSPAGGYHSGSSKAKMDVNVGGTFELHGTKLVAAIHNTERKNNLIK